MIFRGGFVFALLALAFPVRSALASEEPLPLIEVPATAHAPDAPLLVMLSGDGGWAEFVSEISRRLADDGWSVVGLDLRKYLWTRRTPEEAAAAVARIARAYEIKWHRSRFVLAGFSRGADVTPFVVNRLPAPLLATLDEVVLLSPGREAEFEFHLVDFLRDPRTAGRRPVLPELQKVQVPILLFHGTRDREALVPTGPARTLHVFGFDGDHHLGRDYARIIGLIRASEHEGPARSALPPAAPR